MPSARVVDNGPLRRLVLDTSGQQVGEYARSARGEHLGHITVTISLAPLPGPLRTVLLMRGLWEFDALLAYREGGSCG